MQTFITSPDFAVAASQLDDKRLGKQRVETKQILQALVAKRAGIVVPGQNHPVVLQWAGYEALLAAYGVMVCAEWIKRGFKDTQIGYFREMLKVLPMPDHMPPWLTDPRLASNHRARLLAKNWAHYSRFGWTEAPEEHNLWPVTKDGTWIYK